VRNAWPAQLSRPIDFVTNGGTRVVTDQNGRKTTTNWVIEGQSPVLRDDALWQGNNAQQKNLLSILLSGTDSEQAKSLVSLSAFRPGIFSDFLFEVEISPPDCKVSLEEIQVQVTFEAESAPTDEMLLCVDNNLRMAIPLMIFLAVPADSNRPISESWRAAGISRSASFALPLSSAG
jgi:hypothetical protein